MELNKYSFYSIFSQSENKNKDDCEKMLKVLEKLHSFEDMNTVKEWLLEVFHIRDDVHGLAITPNIRISAITGQKYFNVTLEYQKEIKSFNYKKGDNE